MCGSLVPPEKGEDPVKAYGWDRVKDETIIAQLQTQYRNVVLECYKLGYRRTVLAFQPFLAHAKYWYQRYADWVLSPAGTTELRNRILARAETGSTLYNIQVKLTLLKDAAGGDIGDAVDVKDALAELQGAAALPFLEQVEWNKETQDELLEIFRQIDLLEQHGGKEWQEHQAYHQHRELLEARGRTTWTDLLSETIAGLEKLRENKKWTMMEAANILALANDQLARARAREFRQVTRLDETLPFRVPPRMALPELAWRVAASHIRAAMMVVATSCMLRVLVDPETNKDLSALEKVTLWGSIVDSFATLKDNYVLNLAGRGLAVVGRFFVGVANIVCRAIGRALTFIGAQWLVDSIRAAANWTANAVRRGVNWLKRGWEKVGDFAMKVFGFAMAVCSVVSSAFDFESALKSGRLTDRVFTGINVVLAGLEVLCMTIHGIAWLAGATAVCNACSFLGPVLAATGVVVAIIAITVNYFLKDPDPVEHFITKYGQEYKLLVGMRKKA
ncbi:hypothetical protein EXIGLDRAFT_256675 [Exidia glandulosa HHB12029]|uniref:Uncharacterized protein n=1 Tax=Exidia glandulosa HHB12029 TaxID=1314781 RepID=A0A165DV62_EXIGL|nr:hypothetical protein EXIGLDRAFT_256675 [Exidia glandulosa HHB12029]